MKRRTYNNVLKAAKMIAAKGYDWNTAGELARKCFDNLEQNKNGMSAEWYINQISEKREYVC